MKIRLGIFISGGGSNMQSIAKACQQDSFPAQVSLVLSNTPDAKGLQLAKQLGLKTAIVDHQNFSNRKDFEQEIQKHLVKAEIELVCLAGFMRILSPFLVEKWQDKMLNIHPSLLPKFRGLNTHKRALNANEKTHGCSVHFVTVGLDEGPVIAQSTIQILADDTIQTLQARVLIAEHILYPQTIKQLCQQL
ncbi:MAG: phosphoribosylglycinamide formyltransferase [Robiginitomaculum sp.]|nr:phosphoribosylglycinamide formyltransferase [Robiginitomaculum sp.]